MKALKSFDLEEHAVRKRKEPQFGQRQNSTTFARERLRMRQNYQLSTKIIEKAYFAQSFNANWS